MSDLPHPSHSQLAALKVGKLEPPESVEVETHLAACDTCCEAMNTLPDDSLVKLLQAGRDSVEAGGATLPLESLPAGAGAAELHPGLADHARYHLLELVGKGGMGAVYKAEHRLMGRLVALKVMNAGLMKKPAMVERFRREVQAAARFTHPNIVTAFDADQAGDAHFLIMEFVQGISLAEHVARHGPLPVPEACDYVRQAAEGLQFAAEHGMVHRDIKPHNLMLTQSGRVKVLDFGLARLVREEADDDLRAAAREHAGEAPAAAPLTEVGTLMGTADFIAPEQADDPRRADVRADIYSLGCTLYYLLAGHAPFAEGSALDKLRAHRQAAPAPVAKLRPDVPAGLARVLDRMMAKDPAQRYPSPREAAEALQPFTAAGAAGRRRAKRLALAAAALFASVLLAAAVIYVRTDHGELVIDTGDDRVAVMVNDKGVKIRDEATNREYLVKAGPNRLRPGDYKIDVQELPAGVRFVTTEFSLNRGGKTVLKVSFDAGKDPGYLKDDALRWFPADATYFTATNVKQLPAVAQYQLYFFAESPSNHGRFWKFNAHLGRMDRASYAYVGDEKSPDFGSTFLRLTGAINHKVLVEFFRKDWPGAVIEKLDAPGEPVTLIYDAKSEGVMSGAWALIGTSDVLNASAGKTTGKKHVDVLRKMLELRAGRGLSLPAAHARELAEVPPNTGSLSMGKTPGFMKKIVPFVGSLPERMDATLSGTSDIELRFRTTFSSEVSTQLFLATIKVFKQGFLEVAKTLQDPDLSGSVVQAMESLRLETGPNRVAGSMQIPGAAWAALTEALRDIPPEKLTDKEFIPGKEKRDPGRGAGAANSTKAAGYLKDDALRWFPADATFYSAYDLQVFPALAHVHGLLFREEILTQAGPAPRRERLGKLVDLMGRLDRISLAYSLKPQPPQRARTFMRFTGSIARNRLLDFFRREWPGLQIEERQANGEPIALIYDAPGSVSLDMAVVLVGNTDMIWAAYQGPGIEREVAEECLRLRAGQGVRLPVAQAKALEEIPDDAFAFGVGETPEFLKKNLMVPALLVQPRSFVLSIRGTSDVDFRFRGDFANDADAERFMTIMKLMKQGFANAPAVLKRADVAAAVGKALESLEIRTQGNRLSCNVHVPAEAWAALVEKLQDMPLRDYSGSFRPGESGAARGQPKRPPGYLKDDALRWFPADATFFIVMDMGVFPEITRLPFLITSDREGEQARRFFDVVGSIDRTAVAWAENREQPGRSRNFFRLTGKIARDRVLDHFRRHWKGSLREEKEGEEIVILHDARQGTAIALIGTTDLVIAAYDGPRQDGLPVLRECLDLRAGRGTSLPAAQAAVLGEIPDDAWIFAVGKPDEFFKQEYLFAFMRPIRSIVCWLRGTGDVEMGFRGSFATAEEAKRFNNSLDLMKRIFTKAPAVMKDAELSAAVVRAFESLQGENEGARFKGGVRIPSRAWAALVDKIANTPLKDLIESPALTPAKEK